MDFSMLNKNQKVFTWVWSKMDGDNVEIVDTGQVSLTW